METSKKIAREVKAYLDERDITLAEVAERMGVSQQAVSNQLSGRKIGESVARKWADIFGFSVVYLMTGEGRLLQNECVEDTTPEGGELLVLPMSARAGSLADYADGASVADCERMISPIRGADFAMQVTGDSMSPEYPSGSHIILKRIDPTAFVEWGRVYLLDTDNGPILKIVRRTEAEGVVECVSLNPAYQPFTVPARVIRGWYRVLMCLSLK